MLQKQVPTVHVNEKWPFEVLYIGDAVVFGAHLHLAAEMNAKGQNMGITVFVIA